MGGWFTVKAPFCWAIWSFSGSMPTSLPFVLFFSKATGSTHQSELVDCQANTWCLVVLHATSIAGLSSNRPHLCVFRIFSNFAVNVLRFDLTAVSVLHESPRLSSTVSCRTHPQTVVGFSGEQIEFSVSPLPDLFKVSNPPFYRVALGEPPYPAKDIVPVEF
jgi:hypothetical protein